MKAGVTSGVELVSAIEAAAAARGVTPASFVRPITGRKSPHGWLASVRFADRPRATTIERVRELLAGELPAPPRPYVRQAGAGCVETPAMPVPEPVDREPCFRCGVRGDIGCKHRGGGPRHGL